TASQGGAWLFERASSLQSPSRIQFGRGDGKWHQLSETKIDSHHPYHPFVDEHVTPELGTLTAEDGQTLHYSLTRPQSSTEPVPLIVFVYGGPGVQRVRNEWPPLPLQLFVQRGFGVLELDNRGSANRGRRFEAPIHRRLGQAEVCDQALGVEFAANLPWVDAGRIGVFGHSYGGYMALMCLAQVPQRFRAGVAVAPVTDWRLYDTHYTERYLGHPKDNAEGYEASSVLTHIDGIQGKLLLMHGMSDDNVVFTHSMRLMTALQEANIPFELMTYPGAKHSMQQKAVAIHRFNLILDFFERHLCE
ncbi:MAG: alpha/beta fold hydrolase, partial [Gammaproteobacteria bacterium]|nr:alpha/beta fold hydrolase [Gammaproteobacteria bacterium]